MVVAAWQGGLGQQWQDLADAALPCSVLPQIEAARPLGVSVAPCVHQDVPTCGLSPASVQCFVVQKRNVNAARKHSDTLNGRATTADAAVLQAPIDLTASQNGRQRSLVFLTVNSSIYLKVNLDDSSSHCN